MNLLAQLANTLDKYNERVSEENRLEWYEVVDSMNTRNEKEIMQVITELENGGNE